MEKDSSIEKKREEVGEGEESKGPSTSPLSLLQHMRRGI
jgi:hypothetical protein